MTKYQNIAIFIAFLAVIYQIITLGTIPLVSIGLALTFAFYGMIRKKINVGSIVGLFIETLILMPFAIIGIYYLIVTNKISFLHLSEYIDLMLSLGGLITIIPLLLFNGAATRMKLSTLGFFQYIGPSCSFLLAVFIYNEELNFDKLITFCLIWIALVIFSLDSINSKQKAKKLNNN
ncbi:MAG: hypothetical protein U5K55_04995 [Aliarcobacter sp.]|nr:hypothetical protein [Aliarcobacter sp.]